MLNDAPYTLQAGADRPFLTLGYSLIVMATAGALIRTSGTPEGFLILFLCILITLRFKLSHARHRTSFFVISPDGTIKWQNPDKSWAYGTLRQQAWATSRYAVIGIEGNEEVETVIISRGLQNRNNYRKLLSGIRLMKLGSLNRKETKFTQ